MYKIGTKMELPVNKLKKFRPYCLVEQNNGSALDNITDG